MADPDIDAFSAALRQARKDAGLTQDKLGSKVGDMGTLAGTIDLDWHSAIMPKS